MSKSGKKNSVKRVKAGQRMPAPGIYEVAGPRGGTGQEIAAVRGKPLPPVPKSAKHYTLRAKSGRYIITSPAESANSVMTWSKAFKKK
jgi:hypothetical protein